MSHCFSLHSPEELGIPSSALCDVLNELDRKVCLNKSDSMHGIMVLRHGKLAMEGWWAPCSPDIPHALFSVSKTFVSMAIGLAQQEGRLNLSDPICSFFPEYDSDITDGKMRQVTIRHLLTMASGHDADACPSMFSEPRGNWVRGFLSSQLALAPGERFTYNSAGTYMLSAIIRKTTGVNVREYLQPRLFEPMAMQPGMWECCPRGINKGGWGFYLRTEDLAKFGQLLLQKGQWEGKQLLPADYLAEATSKQISNDPMGYFPDWIVGYGYQLWISRHGFRVDGASGQFAVVVPEYDLVIATNAGTSVTQNLLEVFWDTLLPALSPSPLPANPDNEKRLRQACRSLSLPILPRPEVLQPLPLAILEFQDNQDGLHSLELAYEKDSCLLCFHTARGLETLQAGFGHYCSNSLQLRDEYKRLVEACATWEDRKLCLTLKYPETSVTEFWTLDLGATPRTLACLCAESTFRPSSLPELLTERL